MLRILSIRAASLIATAAQDDDSYDYYLMRVTSDGLVTLSTEETKDYGCQLQAGNTVLKGRFFLIDMTYKLKVKKKAMVYPGTVRYVCSELKKKGKGRNEVYQVAMDVHEDIIASL